MLVALAVPPAVFAVSQTPLEREASEAYQRADYGAVLRLLPPASSDVIATERLLRLALESATKIGRPEEGLDIYERLHARGHADDASLLRQLGVSFLSAYVRDSREYLRIAAYSALAELH